MFWILRRTGAVNFFNSFNNNCSTSKVNNRHQTQDKYVKRPPRKEYGRLSGDSDDATSFTQKPNDNHFEDHDNFELITTSSTNCINNNESCINTNDKNNRDDEIGFHNVGKNNQTTDGNMNVCGLPDCEGNFDNFCSGSICNNEAGGINEQRDINGIALSRLQAMAMSDDEDFDESLTCNVCDRAFYCHRQLASHQQKKRHFGCTGCDSLFPSLMLLEHHKEEFEHWSDDDIGRRVCCRRNREYFTDTDSFTSEAESEDLERLL